MNPAGSIKDRISLEMMKDAKSGNYIKETTEFVEPTSGNTGIGVAFLAAMMGNIILADYLILNRPKYNNMYIHNYTN